MTQSSAKRDPLREGLVLLCGYLGHGTTPDFLAEGLILEQGMLPLDLVTRALRNADISARIQEFSLEKINQQLLPALILLDNGETLLAIQKTKDHIKVLDPLSNGGEQLFTIQDLKEIYSGIIVFGKPQFHMEAHTGIFAIKEGEHWFRGPILKFWKTYSSVAIAALVSNLLAISISLFAMQVYDRVVPNEALDTLWILAAGVFTALILEFVLKVLRTHILDATGKKLDLNLSSRLFQQLLQIRLQNKPGSSGAFSNQIREFESVRDFMTSTTVSAISDLPFVALFLLVIYVIGGQVVWVTAIGMVLILIPGLLAQWSLAKYSRINMHESTVKNALLLESVDNLQSIKAFRAEGRLLSKWEQLTAKLSTGELKSRSLTAKLAHFSSLIQQTAYVGLIVFGVYQINAGLLTVGGLIACTILASRAIAPLANVTALLTRWQYVKVALSGLNDFMKMTVDRPAGRTFARKTHIKGDYRIERLRFNYNSEAPTALAIDQLQIPAGSKVALLGGNGAGKSTLLKILSGLISPSEGTVSLDDVNLDHLDPSDLRRSVGYLPQDNVIFYGTLRENLCLHSNVYSDDEIFEVLDGVGLGDFVRKHHLGLDMLLEGSGSISGGQRQAVGLARLILLNPHIVLLDEPTSAYDQANEMKVLNYLKTWLAGKTLVLATHKRNMLALTERVLVLQDGMLVKDGLLDSVVSGNQVKVTEGAL